MPIEITGNQAIITSDGTRRYFYVPANVISGTIEYNLIGGGGGGGGSDYPYGGGHGGAAGIVKGTLNVNSGDLIELIVGGGGTRGESSRGSASGGAGGLSYAEYRGGAGGNAGHGGSSGGGGGGGGATVLKVNGVPKAIAAGNGGGGGGGHWEPTGIGGFGSKYYRGYHGPDGGFGYYSPIITIGENGENHPQDGGGGGGGGGGYIGGIRGTFGFKVIHSEPGDLGGSAGGIGKSLAEGGTVILQITDKSPTYGPYGVGGDAAYPGYGGTDGGGGYAFISTNLITRNLRHKVNGTWMSTNNAYVKTAGTWKVCPEVWIKNNGTWQRSLIKTIAGVTWFSDSLGVGGSPPTIYVPVPVIPIEEPVITTTDPPPEKRGVLKDILCHEPRVDGSATVYYHDGAGGEYKVREKRLTACPIETVYEKRGVLKDILCHEPKVDGSATVYYHDGAGGEYEVGEKRLTSCPITVIKTPTCTAKGIFIRESTQVDQLGEFSRTIVYHWYADGLCGEYAETHSETLDRGVTATGSGDTVTTTTTTTTTTETGGGSNTPDTGGNISTGTTTDTGVNTGTAGGTPAGNDSNTSGATAATGTGESVSISAADSAAAAAAADAAAVSAVADAPAAAAPAAAAPSAAAAAPADAPGGDGGSGKIICTKLFELGLMSEEIYLADQAFGAELVQRSPDIYNGYRAWAEIVVDWMDGHGPKMMPWMSDEEFSAAAKKWSTTWAVDIATPWAEEMAYVMGKKSTGSLTGRMITAAGIPICKAVGVWQRVFGPSKKPAGFGKGLMLIPVFIMFKLVAELGRLIEGK